MPKLMLVDDEVVITTQLEEVLTSMGYEVLGTATSGEEAVEMAKDLRPALILMDIVMPGELDGIAAAEKIKAELDISIIFLTAHTDKDLVNKAKHTEPGGYVLKPFQEEQIRVAIEIALYKRDIEKRLQKAHDELERRVEERTSELLVANKNLLKEIADRRLAQKRLQERTHDLGKRVKELSCLYGISNLYEDKSFSLKEIIQGVADLIPPSWQYPEITCARVILEGQEFRTENFKETDWKQSCDIIANGVRLGALEVCYLEGKPKRDEGPCLKEERRLINAIASRLGRIVEHKRAEETLGVSNRFLEIANKHTDMGRMLKDFVVEIKDFTGCAAVGVRILDKEGNIPYNAYKGFSQNFYESESPLSIKSDQCMCINVIQGETNPKLSFYTEGGSFYMNGTTRFLATVSEEEKGQTRNVCNEMGYESVALVPIRMGHSILGLIHIADPREDMVPLERVNILERAAMQVGEAFQRIYAEMSLKKAYDELEFRVEKRTDELNKANEQLEREIEERKGIEETLRESEEKYRAIFEQAGDSIVLVDTETTACVEFNTMAYKTLGYTSDEFKKLKISDIDVDRSYEALLKNIKRRVQERVFKLDSRHKTKDGKIRNVQITGKSINIRGKNFNLAIWNDITDRKQAEAQIKASLKEKELLLGEVYHRVKNNMQLVASLLNLQAANIKEKQYADMFKESRDRVRSMAHVHEKLYQSEDLANVDFKGYVKSLSNTLFRAYATDPNKIRLQVEVKDVSLGLKTAIPCGLLINELLTNSLKHAFPEGREGEIRISIRPVSEDTVEFIFSDNGVGIPEDLDIKKTDSFGMFLINILAEDQLRGKIELDRTGGTKFVIQLKRQELAGYIDQ